MLLPSHSYYDIILKDHNKVRSVSHKVYYMYITRYCVNINDILSLIALCVMLFCYFDYKYL